MLDRRKGPAAGKRQWWPDTPSRPREHHGPGVKEAPDTGRISPLRNMETPSRSGGSDPPPVGQPQGRQKSGRERMAKKRMAAVERQRESDGARPVPPTGSLSYNWPYTRPGAWARKGADVSRVAL
jgi:hypothetical protein